MDASHLHSIRVLALREVWASLQDEKDPDSPQASPEYQEREVYYAYSEHFHTPLHEVYDLPEDFVWRAFFERIYYKQLAEADDPQSDEKWYGELDRMADTPEEAAKRRLEDAKDRRASDRLLAQTREENRLNEELAAKKTKEPGLPGASKGPTMGDVRSRIASEAGAMPGRTGTKDPDWLLGGARKKMTFPNG